MLLRDARNELLRSVGGEESTCASEESNDGEGDGDGEATAEALATGTGRLCRLSVGATFANVQFPDGLNRCATEGETGLLGT